MRTITASLALFGLIGCASRVAAPPPKSASEPASPAPGPAKAALLLPAVPAPVIRIGLASDAAEFVLPAPGTPWIVAAGGKTEVRRGPLTFRAVGAAPVVRIQTGAFSEEEAARAAAADLGRKTGLASSVAFSAEKGLYLARLGAFGDSVAAGAELQKLKASGLDGFLVAESSGTRSFTVRDESGSETPLPGATADIGPGSEGVSVVCGGKAYRGLLRLLVNPRGSINVINLVNLEDYLRGVVPAEMGPKRFDELEALKAQAIAARTYAVDGRNAFAGEGYDLCATPKCQAYAGREAEDPLTDSAVEQTRGRIATWEGKPIHALFTSTCGGATEDVSVIFPAMTGPYLSGVPCGEQEKSMFDGARVSRSSRGRALSALEWRGWVLTRLAAAGRRSSGRSGVWAEALRLAGLPARGGAPASLSPVAVFPAVLAGFGLSEGRDLHLTKFDLDYAAGPPDPSANLPSNARTALLTLERLKIGGDAGLPSPSRTMSELEFGGLLMSVALRLSGVTESSGHLVRRDGGNFLIKTALGRVAVAADTSTELARLVDGRFYPASEVALTSGDPVAFWKRGSAVLAFWAVEAAAGGSFEKESTWTEWIRRFSARELAIRLASRVPGTEVRSIEIRKRGRSGRAIEASIATDKGAIALRGFDIRQALQLPELLFSVQKGSAADGSPEFIFAGRGWGHGVGLCQNGAYGMALAGRNFEEILKHYYPGIEVASLPAGGWATPPAR